jgi:hypothetical protein
MSAFAEFAEAPTRARGDHADMWLYHSRQADRPLQRSHAEAPQPLLVLEEAAGAKRVQGVNYVYFGIRHQYLS